MSTSLRLAAAQFPVSGDVARNARTIRRQATAAARAGAQIVHFPETALPGYAPKHLGALECYDWRALEAHTENICRLAASLGLWIVLGSMRRIGDEAPRNCTLVISTSGAIAGVYDKQRLYDSEKALYSPGNGSCVVEICGFKCGFLICYDNCFPELYEAYRHAGVRLLFHSFYNAANAGPTSIQDLMLANLRVRAADNQMWISAANSSERHSPLAACVVRPDGSMIRTKRNKAGLAVDDFPRAVLGWTYDNRRI